MYHYTVLFKETLKGKTRIGYVADIIQQIAEQIQKVYQKLSIES